MPQKADNNFFLCHLGKDASHICYRNKNKEQLVITFSPATAGCLKATNDDSFLVISRIFSGFPINDLKSFRKIIVVYERYPTGILDLLEFLQTIKEYKRKDALRNRLFLLIPRGRYTFGEHSPSYEIQEDDLIPIDIDDLDELPRLPHTSTDPNSIPVSPYRFDWWPDYRDLQSWISALQTNVLTFFLRELLYPKLRTGLLESQEALLSDKNMIAGYEGVEEMAYFVWPKTLFNHCIDFQKLQKRKYRNREAYSHLSFEMVLCGEDEIEWYRKNSFNELGCDLIPTSRPCIIPLSVWNKNKWAFEMEEDERHPLFPLLLWEGHHAQVLGLECFIPSYNFHEIIDAMMHAILQKPIPEIYPDSVCEKWVDVSDFRDGTGTITLAPLCKQYSIVEKDGQKELCAELTLKNDHYVKEFLKSFEKSGGSFRYPIRAGSIHIYPDNKKQWSYAERILSKAQKPRKLKLRQVLWDGSCFRQFKTGELVKFYSKSLIESFDGNRDCALYYLNALSKKYCSKFKRTTKIINKI